jgi:hypothetical protein
MIEKLAGRGDDLHLRADVCVIGSGAGGAVAAAELAEAGLDVVVLEQGHHWTSADFTQREDEMLPRLFEEAGMRQTEDGSVLVLQGRCIGGSTVHNLCYAFRTPDPILRMWRDEHGLPELTPAAMAASFERVERTLKVKQIRDDEVNALNAAIRRGTEALGWSGFVTKHNREGCVQAGYCILGCSYDAKQSMLITYVPKAERAGARIFANARADRICVANGRTHGVHGRVVDPQGREGGRIEVEAPVVVLAAGAIASPALLLASGIANRSGQVGRNLHLHPSVMVAGYFDEPLHAYRGIPQSYYVDEFIDLERDPHRGYVLMPIAGESSRLRARSLPLAARLCAHGRIAGTAARPERGQRRARKRRVEAAHPLRARARGCAAARRGRRALLRAAARGRCPRSPGAVLERSAGVPTRRRSLGHHTPWCASGRDRDRFDASAVHLPDGRRSADVGRGRVGGIARSRGTLRRRHERVPDVTRRTAADHHGGAGRPHGAADPRAMERALRRGACAPRGNRYSGLTAGETPATQCRMSVSVISPTSSSPSTTGRQPIR